METKTCCSARRDLNIHLKTGTTIFVVIIALFSCLSLYFIINSPASFTSSDLTNRYSGFGKVPVQKDYPSSFITLLQIIILASCAMAGYSMLKNQRMFLMPFMVITTIMFGILLIAFCVTIGFGAYRNISAMFESFFLIMMTYILIVTSIFFHFIRIVWSLFAEMGKRVHPGSEVCP